MTAGAMELLLTGIVCAITLVGIWVALNREIATLKQRVENLEEDSSLIKEEKDALNSLTNNVVRLETTVGFLVEQLKEVKEILKSK